ncbi:iron-containing alcohol dehydrogenase [Umboniibacter marinipuniceus]|uniref:Alcohol dehydrogenase class IV n=1 Tax=Umboniibacter marinipuniceus TaxID=569599 RepID=A0A3M0A5W0_9GAMM|nr:iron-containing alcohol dehydrogenase [Umboniibacter marinipuniceus]RMA80160.1 alcohol dehydrogenase class IV [Umboniibacter marinipuniceus]
MNFSSITPRFVECSEGALLRASSLVDAIGSRRCFILTDKTAVAMGYHKQLVDHLAQAGVYADSLTIDPNESVEGSLNSVKQHYLRAKADLLIAFGSSQTLVRAKVTRHLMFYRGESSDLARPNEVSGSRVPLLLIPSTPSAAIEIAKPSALNTEAGVLEFQGHGLMPTAVLIDAKLFANLSQAKLVESGIAALALAIEAFLSRRSSLVSDLYSLEVVSYLYGLLKKLAHQDGIKLSIQERSQFLNSCYWSGLAITNSSPALLTGMSTALVQQFNLGFSWSVGALLPGVLQFSLSSATARLERLCVAAGLAMSGESRNRSAMRFVQEITKLVDSISLPSLAEQRLDRTEVLSLSSRLTQAVQHSGFLANHPRLATNTELTQIYRSLA